MLTYQTNDPRGWGGDPRRGAALGRATIIDIPPDAAPRLYVGLVRMSACGDYDVNGTYWGRGRPLYWVHDADGTVDFVVRADDRLGAQRIALQRLPNATFSRRERALSNRSL